MHNPQVKCYLLHFFPPIKCLIHGGIAKVELLRGKNPTHNQQTKTSPQVNICTNEHRIDVRHALRRVEVPRTGWGRAQQRAVGELSMAPVISPSSASVPRGEISAASMGDRRAVPVGNCSRCRLWHCERRFSFRGGSKGCSLWYSICMGGAEESDKLILNSKTYPSFLWHYGGCKSLRHTIYVAKDL